MIKRTKIVATLSVQRCTEELVRSLFKAGMNIVRINSAHASLENAAEIIRMVRSVSNSIPVMLDTKGPEYRIGTFADGKIELHSGDTFTFTTEPVTGNAERVSVSYAGLAQDLEPGNTVLVNDGLIALRSCCRPYFQTGRSKGLRAGWLPKNDSAGRGTDQSPGSTRREN